ILDMPELAEKRTVTGTSCLKCNALLTLAASALGTNLPSRTTPLAWADRCVVCLPNAELSASTNVSGVAAIAGSFRVFIAVFRWNDPAAFVRLRKAALGQNRRPCASASCPLYPQKRTWISTVAMSALCQKRTYAVQQSRFYSITTSATGYH